MSLHKVDFEYNVPEWGTMTVEIDPVLDHEDKELIAMDEIKEFYRDIVDVNITEIKEV